MAVTLGGSVASAAIVTAFLVWTPLAGPAAAIPTPAFGWPRAAGPAILLMLIGLLQWRLLRRGPGRTDAPAPVRRATVEAPAREESPAARKNRERRLFVHLLGRLQREGRLMDFLSEDLDDYEDAQIGAAVRSVHAGCRRVVDRLLAPRPVMAEAEETAVTLAADYDPKAITLSGRVGDTPPFAGVVRHPGWRAGRIDIPELSDETDPTIIAAAEVEVR